MLFALPLAGLFVFATGALALLCPRKLWAGFAPPHSKLANQMSVGALLLFGGLFITGTGLTALYCADAYRGWRSTHWPEVDATILSSRIVEVRQIRSVNNAYRPEAEYRYTVAGIEYRSDRVDISGASTVDREWLEEQLAGPLAPGATIIAYVNPADPAQATLQTGIPQKALVFVALGIAFIAIGGYYVQMLLRDWNGDGTTNQSATSSKAPASRTSPKANKFHGKNGKRGGTQQRRS